MKLYRSIAAALAVALLAAGSATAQPVQSSTAPVQYSEDAAHSSGHKGFMALCVRKDTAASTAGTDGDYAAQLCDALGRSWVNVGALPALPAGTNNIGDVDVLTLPALPAGTNNIGDVDLASALPAGANNIGDVDVLTLPALPAGTNNIGDVDVLTLPALAAGTNNIGDVDLASALPAGTNNIGDVDVLTLPALPAGTNNIGDIDVLTMPGQFAEDSVHSSGASGSFILGVRKDTASALAGTDGEYSPLITDSSGLLWSRIGAALPAGTNNIGDVDVLTLPVAFNAGAASSTTLRTVAASDSPELAILAAIEAAAEDTTPVAVNLASAATGGCTPYGYQSAASNNSTNVKASAATLCSLNVINTTATLYYLRLYNLASAPTCSSATGFVKTVPVPASATGAGVALDLGAFGESYGTGLGFCLTAGGSSTDNTSAVTGVYVMASYK